MVRLDNDETLMYGMFGKVSHIVRKSSWGYLALCHHDTNILQWFGTGNQGEYDRAERLPLCSDCKRIHETLQDQ